jgi:hypothetical protein
MNMKKITPLIAGALMLSASTVFAQTSHSATDAPYGANGAAPRTTVGSNPNVAAQPPAATTSSSMLEQKNKKDSANGAASSTYNTKP